MTPQHFAKISRTLCENCREKLEAALYEYELLREEEPGWVYKAPMAAVLTKECAREVGLSLYRLHYEQNWPRRSIINRLHHDFDKMIDRGLLPREPDGETLDFHEDYLDEVMPQDPSCSWISCYATAAKQGANRTPSKKMYERLARLKMVLQALGRL